MTLRLERDTHAQHTLLHTPSPGPAHTVAQHTLVTYPCCIPVFRTSPLLHTPVLLWWRRARYIPCHIPCYIPCYIPRAAYPATYPAIYPATYLLQTPVPRGSLGRVFVDTPNCDAKSASPVAKRVCTWSGAFGARPGAWWFCDMPPTFRVAVGLCNYPAAAPCGAYAGAVCRGVVVSEVLMNSTDWCCITGAAWAISQGGAQGMCRPCNPRAC